MLLKSSVAIYAAQISGHLFRNDDIELEYQAFSEITVVYYCANMQLYYVVYIKYMIRGLN